MSIIEELYLGSINLQKRSNTNEQQYQKLLGYVDKHKLYYVKKDTSRLNGITDGFNL